MAKTQIKNYLFKPGIGALDNLFPKGYSLIQQNKEFILSEIVEYINKEIQDATKCERDIQFILDGIKFDIVFDTNYNANFLGLAELNSLDLSNTVIRAIDRARNNVLALSPVQNSIVATARTNQAFNKIINIIKNGASAVTEWKFENQNATQVKIAVRDKITANIDFITAEVNAWVEQAYPARTHNVDKCTRDVQYALYAAIYDTVYGGNSASYDSARFFYYFAESEISGITTQHRLQTVAAYNHLIAIIQNIVQGTAIVPSAGNSATQIITGANSDPATSANLAQLLEIVRNVVRDGISSLPVSRIEPTVLSEPAALQTAFNSVTVNSADIIENTVWDVDYTYDRDKCKRDLEFVLDAYLHDVRYGGNEKLLSVIRYYWDNDVAQVDGNRIPEFDTHAFVGELIQDYILKNIQYPARGVVPQIIDESIVPESLSYTPTAAAYNPESGEMTLTLGEHSLSAGTPIYIAPNSLTFTCAQDNFQTEHTYPRAYGAAIDPVQYTPADALYDPTTGQLTLTIIDHAIQPGEYIKIKDQSIRFTCGLDGNMSEHAYPRATGSANPGGADPVYNTPIEVLSITENTITVNVGVSSNQTAHTFVSAQQNAVSTTTADPFFNTVVYVKSATSTSITVNVGVSSNKTGHRFISAASNSVTTSASQAIGTLVSNTVDVITNGLSSMPVRVIRGVGFVKIQGRYGTDDLLLITNTSRNEVIYNFTSPSTGASIELNTSSVDEDHDYKTFLQTTDAVTTITLNYNTRTHSASDDIQIFVEEREVRTRPFDFGTDAIERMRIAPPLSMLDADFEYGLQPTKWSAIGTLRGYPSVYEVPGTDTAVLSVATDASAGTEGIGQSLITVTTVSPHGFTPGTPITIKALENSVVGAARAEGSFIITEVPTPTTFTFYAKAKVGSIPGEVLSTTYTQLREAGFYTGATIGNSTFEVLSNGSNGTLFTQLAVLAGSTSIPYDGPSPEIGAPLTVTGIPLGTQVSGILDTSAGGGTYITPTVVGNYPAGSTTITVSNASGIPVGLSVDRGDGYAIQIASINDNALTFSSQFVSNIIGNVVTYTGISGNNDFSIGTGAEFDISVVGSNYNLLSVANTGSNYQVGDRIIVSGESLGGFTPDNDLTLVVSEVFSDGAIVSATISGTPFTGEAVLENVSATYLGGQGTAAIFDVEWANGEYTVASISSPDNSAGFIVNDVIRIPGDVIDPVNGVSPTNDAFVKVTGTGTGGSIVSTTIAGVAPDRSSAFTDVAWTTSGVGVNAVFNVTITGSVYSVVVLSGGADFLPGDTITVSGTVFGDTAIINDLTITVSTVDGTGAITAITTSGTAANVGAVVSATGINFVGSGAEFEVSISSGLYTVITTSTGSQYSEGQQLVIQGSSLLGTTPENNLVITITGVDGISSGAIDTITHTGTAVTGSTGALGAVGVLQQPSGSNSAFTIIRNFNEYTTVNITSVGSAYAVGNRIIIPGTSLGGLSPLNDILIRVTGVTSEGAIQTFVTEYNEAFEGINFDLISTITISEETTSDLLIDTGIDFASLASIKITFDNAHGIVPGGSFIVSTSSDDDVNNHALASGPYIATSVPNINELVYQARAAGAIDTSTQEISGNVYPRPDSFFIHRPYDGGVQLGTGGPQHGAQAIRQSKKYIRYQSGKGIMYTTGALFAPSYDVRSVTADGVEVGSVITIVTDDTDHGVQVGGVVRLLGIETPGYNSGPSARTPPHFDYTVVSVVNERTFRVLAQRRLGSTTAKIGFAAQMSVVSWHGASVRSGIFDDQNGIFWEYNGTEISVVQRTSTKQLAGTIAIEVDNNLITGTNTRFRDQVFAGERIVIKGMTHVVSHVISDTQMTVTPDWRGVVDVTGVKANLVSDKRVKQSDFNLDRLDGTGPSGYNIDISKMQMIGIQFSWYGAGFIDFMLRGADGNFVFAHRMRNSNVNTEAYMRSGNLPVRYEVVNEGPVTYLVDDIDDSQEFLHVDNVEFLPEFGTLYIDNEIIEYEGKDLQTNRLLNLTRNATFSNYQAGATRFYNAGAAVPHAKNTGVILISNTITPIISHWGSAFITDGGFDEDRGYIFSYAETRVSISTIKQTAFMIRLAPSVSNAITGDLGERELLNRAQLLLQGIEITSKAGDGEGIVVEGVLNPQNYPVNPNLVTWSGLTSLAQGGQPSFAQIAAGGAITWSTEAAVTPVTVTTTAFPSGTITLSDIPWRNGIQYTQRDSNFVVVSSAEYSRIISEGMQIGDVFIHPAFTAPTTVTGFRGPFQGGVYTIDLSRRPNVDDSVNSTATVEKRYRTSSTSEIWFEQSSFENAAIRPGIDVTDNTFPAGTLVNTISQKTYFSTTYYAVTFNGTSDNTTIIPGTTTIEFTFIEPPYAQPGETVFSFIANPGERSTLDLTELKELTNTPLGGRGTFPNGPDVLAINVYKVSGADLEANIILRWGEAQA